MVRPQPQESLRRLLGRDLRRGAHRAGRENQRLHPRLARPRLHRHDRDRRADRPPRRRPLPDPDLALRPRPGGPPRRHLAAALPADPARPGGADDRQGAAAQRRGRPGLRPGGAGRAARPGPVQLRDRRPLQVALPQNAGRRLHRRRPARPQRRRGVPRGRDQRAGGLRPDAEARTGRDPRRLRTRRRRRPHATRSCSPRVGTARGRRSACTSRRPPRGGSTSSGSAA